ncbi:lectin [Micromonospora sp. NPDC049559]|uniref:lectin n=1 Tax=Micromonospora sp. NPDC049559 TaxID=3155923 RepID=UPI00344520F8
MGISRRSILTSAVAGSALAAVAGTELAGAPAASAASPPGDVVGKITVGYQGWFAATGDGSPINGWWHWSQNWGQPPSPSNTTIISWPDMREYTNGYQTAYANLGNGQPARLFSSYDQQTVDTHFRWMQQYGCDTAALQRFNPFGGEGAIRDAMAAKVRTAAEAYGRKFYIMYDVTNWTNMQSEIKTDWTNKMRAYTSSPAYAVQNGKPVVCIWGFGFNDPGRPFAPAACLDVINWFKAQGCYVIGGVPTWWRTGVSDSRPGFLDVYHAFNMISPWMVGRAGTLADLDSYYNNVNVGDQADCNAHGIDYQPCVMPGDLSSGHRRHGDFMWRHFYNMVRLGCQGIYISMFDEYNEGNQIAKTAENASMQPTNFGRRALDEDGTPCSSDYYLRLTADGGRMLKGQLALTATRPTQPVLGSGGNPPPSSGVMSLRARVNGQYVTAENAGAAPLVANRAAVGGWEQFDLVDLGGGNVALRARVNGRYVCADNAGAVPLIANRTAVGPWETFRLVRNGNGSVSLQAAANSRYVQAADAGAAPLVAAGTTIGSWEQFDLTNL